MGFSHLLAASLTACVEPSSVTLIRGSLERQDSLCCTHCCYIDGQCYMGGEHNPANSCLVCDDEGNGEALAWSHFVGDCDDTNSCTDGDACHEGVCMGTPLPEGEACIHVNACITNGICAADGTCEGTPRDCAGAGSGCEAFVCGPQGDCIDPTKTRCMGDGECLDAGASPEGFSCLVCDPATTTAGLVKRPVGTLCGAAAVCSEADAMVQWIGPEVCDDTGACRAPPAIDCGTYRHCGNETTCAQSCVGVLDCTDDATCETGICVGVRAIGASCTSDLQCDTRHCVDDVCCDAACDGECAGCALTLTGMSDGECAPIRDGLDPHADCEPDPPMSCGRDGLCDGRGACRLFSLLTTCGPATCSAFNELEGDHCDGFGACVENGIVSCFPAVCRSGICDFACTADADCASRAWCETATSRCTDANRPPVAILTGPDQSFSNIAISLSGAESYDPDEDSLTYSLTQPVGPKAVIEPGEEGVFNVVLPTVSRRTDLVFSLTVHDGEVASAPADLFVVVLAPDVPQWLGCLTCDGAGNSGAGLAFVAAWVIARSARRRARGSDGCSARRGLL